MRHLSTVFLGLVCGALNLAPSLPAAPAKDKPAEAAQGPAKPAQPELTDKAIQAIGKIKELSDAGKTDEALEVCVAAIPSALPKTLDRALLLQIKAQLHLQQGREQLAVAPLEEALAQEVLEEKVSQDFRLYLCQLHFGAEPSRPAEALAWFDRWQARAPAGSLKPEQVLLRGAILFQMNKTAEALSEAGNALRMEAKPKDQSWMFLLASLQKLDDQKACAEYLELVLRENPGREDLWRQLCQIYLFTEQNLRALLTLERGMALNFFKNPADLETLINLHYNLEHYTAAAALVEKGMAEGRLPSGAKQFELLSFCWQLQGENQKAVAVLDRAAKQLGSGDFNFSAAQILFKDKRLPEAMDRLRLAVADEHLKNPAKAWIFYTYLALELRDLKAAEEGVARLKTLTGAAKEASDFSKALEALKKAALAS